MFGLTNLALIFNLPWSTNQTSNLARGGAKPFQANLAEMSPMLFIPTKFVTWLQKVLVEN